MLRDTPGTAPSAFGEAGCTAGRKTFAPRLPARSPRACESPCSAPMPVMPSRRPARGAPCSPLLCSARPFPPSRKPRPPPRPRRKPSCATFRAWTADIVVDGVLDDAAWATATPIDLAFEVTPGDNTPAPVKTTARMAYTDDALLIAFHAEDPGSVEDPRVPARPRRAVQRRLRRRDARHLRRPAPRVRVLRQSARRAGRPDQGRGDRHRGRQLGRLVGKRRADHRARVRRRDPHPVRDAALPRHRRHAPLGRDLPAHPPARVPLPVLQQPRRTRLAAA